MTTKFPHVLAAVEARAAHERDATGKDLWAIGAAVIRDCGGAASFTDRADQSGKPNGVNKLLDACAKELLKHGYEYDPGTLHGMARTTVNFPASRRYPDVNFFCHSEAKNPDLLDWVIKQVGKEDISGRIVREWVGRWYTLQANKHKQKITDAKTKKSQATTLEGKRAAAEEIKRLGNAMPTPKSNLAAPDAESRNELSAMSGILDIDSDAVSMVKTLRANLAKLHKLNGIDSDLSDALVEHHEQVAEVATQIVRLMSKSRLTSIKGGKSA